MLYRSHKRVTRRQIGGVSSYDSVYQPTYTQVNYDIPTEDYYHQNVSLPDMNIRHEAMQVMKENFITPELCDPINITIGYFNNKRQYGGASSNEMPPPDNPNDNNLSNAPVVSSNADSDPYRPQPPPPPPEPVKPSEPAQPKIQGEKYTLEMKEADEDRRRSNSDLVPDTITGVLGNVTQGFTDQSKDTLQTLQASNQMSSLNTGDKRHNSDSTFTDAVASIPGSLLGSIGDTMGEEYQKDLEIKKEDVRYTTPIVNEEIIKPVMKKLDTFIEISQAIVNPETIPLASLYNSYRDEESVADTLKHFGESIPEALAAGAAGSYLNEGSKAAVIASRLGKLGTVGVVAGEAAEDVKEGKKAGVVVANTGFKLIDLLPGGPKGTILEKGITGLKGVATTGLIAAPFTYDKPKAKPVEEFKDKTTHDKEEGKVRGEDFIIKDNTIRDMLIKNGSDKIYKDNALDIIQEHVDRGNMVHENVQKQLDAYKERQSSIKVPSVEEAVNESIPTNEYEVEDKPVIMEYPDYSGQIETYKSTNLIEPESIDCSKLKGLARKRCERKKLILEARKKQKSK